MLQIKEIYRTDSKHLKTKSLQNRSGNLKSQVMIIEAFTSFEFYFVAYMNPPSQNFL